MCLDQQFKLALNFNNTLYFTKNCYVNAVKYDRSNYVDKGLYCYISHKKDRDWF